MKNFLSNDEFQLDEVLFEHRNRDYGAYMLRHESDQILTKSLFVGVILFAAISATPFIINSFKTEVPVTISTEGTEHIFKRVERPDVPPPVQVIKPVQPQVSTTVLSIPTPAAHPVKEMPAKTLKSTEGKNIGTTEIIGTPPTTTFTPPAVVSTAPPVLVDPPKPVNNSPMTHVDVEARFSKGMDGFRNGMVQNFDASYFEGTGDLIRTTLTFIVEKDGTISDVKANGSNADFNKEAIKTIKSIRGKWTPAKLNGENVRSYFSFPVSMKFE